MVLVFELKDDNFIALDQTLRGSRDLRALYGRSANGYFVIIRDKQNFI
jgi:hypothetical protein